MRSAFYGVTMIKNISRLEHKVGERVFHLLCDSDSPLNEVKESLLQFVALVDKIQEEADNKIKLESENERQ